nr:MAG TPA: hypothetical protein [Caudoviricetes sp.]
MRLIDADNALKAFAAEYRKTRELIDSGESHLDNLAEGFTEAAHIVKYIATTVDAVPVVRCKDCTHFKHYGKTSLLIDGEHIKAGWCYRRVRYNEEYRMPPDGFCFYGERKEVADNGGAQVQPNSHCC